MDKIKMYNQSNTILKFPNQYTVVQKWTMKLKSMNIYSEFLQQLNVRICFNL